MKPHSFFAQLLKEQPLRVVTLIFFNFGASFFEGSSVALFIPLLQMIDSHGRKSADIGRIGRFIQQILALFGLPMTLRNTLMFLFVVVLGLRLIILMQQRLLNLYQFQYEQSLRERLYRAIFSAEWTFFVRQKTGDITNALTAEIHRAADGYFLLFTGIAIGFAIIVYTILAFVISWPMALGATFIGVVVSSGLTWIIRRASKEGAQITQANSDLQSEITEQIGGAKFVKGCAVEGQTVGRFSEIVGRLAEVQARSAFSGAKLTAIYETAVVGVLCVGIYFAVERLRMPIASLIVFLVIFYRLAPRLSNFQSLRRQLMVDLPGVDRVEHVIAEATSFKERRGELPIAKLASGIVLKQVGFAYQPGHPVIKELDLTVSKGRTVAIVGSSGAGKSTVIDLIMGLVNPGSGSIEVDGSPLAEYDMTAWRSLIGYVAQETILFHASVRDNISWAAPGATEADIREASAAANALEFIERMPQGFDTVVGDRGMRLSGGQRQRLALARALVRKPEILILDEATSALDAEAEQKVQQAVETLAVSDMTMIIVTHRLATVKKADLIFVLEDGRLVEKGTWFDLEQASGRFLSLKKLQALD